MTDDVKTAVDNCVLEIGEAIEAASANPQAFGKLTEVNIHLIIQYHMEKLLDEKLQYVNGGLQQVTDAYGNARDLLRRALGGEVWYLKAGSVHCSGCRERIPPGAKNCINSECWRVQAEEILEGA